MARLLSKHVGQRKVNVLCGQAVKQTCWAGEGKSLVLARRRQITCVGQRKAKHLCWPEEGKSPVLARGRQITCVARLLSRHVGQGKVNQTLEVTF